jgi:hypothetical protein
MPRIPAQIRPKPTTCNVTHIVSRISNSSGPNVASSRSRAGRCSPMRATMLRSPRKACRATILEGHMLTWLERELDVVTRVLTRSATATTTMTVPTIIITAWAITGR